MTSLAIWLRCVVTANRSAKALVPSRRRPCLRPVVERLEDRNLPSTFTVLNTNDGGPDSLRQAILDANVNPGADVINFNIAGGGVQTIQPLSALPTIADPVIIDGYTQPTAAANTNGPWLGSNAVLRIELDGTLLGDGGVGLAISAGGSTVRGLVINRFGAYGIWIQSNGGNTIAGNFVGTDATGASALPNSYGPRLQYNTPNAGIVVNSGNNLIGGIEPASRNLISGNDNIGLVIEDSSLSGNMAGNRVEGNLVGTDATGTQPLGNAGDGIGVWSNGYTQTTGTLTSIGGSSPEARNVISANRGVRYDGQNGAAGSGVYLAAAPGTVIQGNYLGTDVTGTRPLGNANCGLLVTFSSDTLVGGTGAGTGNLISANQGSGVALGSSDHARIEGNRIGTDATGTQKLGNAAGVFVFHGDNDIIGGTVPGAGNLISGNGTGVDLRTGRVRVEGNLIGTNFTGTQPLGNNVGVYLADAAVNNAIGGTTPGAGNIISGNGGAGVLILHPGSTGNRVEGNYIGTDVTGNAALGNGSGVFIGAGSSNNTIGGASAAARNIISGNRGNGIDITGVGTTGNVVAGNFIGTDLTGTAPLGNGVTTFGDGIRITGGSRFNRIGTNGDGIADQLERNLISANGYNGVNIVGVVTDDNVVSGNYIGTDVTGAKPLGNGGPGVEIVNGAKRNRIGTNGDGIADVAERNVIAANGRWGVLIFDVGADWNVVAGNYIGTDVTGSQAMANGFDGVAVTFGARFNRIGTNGDGVADTAERNVISGNAVFGVIVTGAGTTANVVAGNYIGTDASGTAVVPNRTDGVRISGGASSNRIGTDGNGIGDPGERNLISGNGAAGVRIRDAGTNFNVIAGNYIGTDTSGGTALPNTTYGVQVSGGAQSNRIGTNGEGVADADERNISSGNRFYGVVIEGTGSNNNVIAGNYVGTDVTGTVAVPNLFDGVRIRNGAQSNRVGTDGNGVADEAERNVISGNGFFGLQISWVAGANTVNNVVAGNYIGTNASGTAAVPNAAAGVSIFAAQSNRIGTNGDGIGDAAERNLISGNNTNGVQLEVVGTINNVVAGNWIGTDATGLLAIPNRNGVFIWLGAQSTQVGGTGPLANSIAFNRQSGVVVRDTGTVNNRIQGNATYANGLLGIDLGNDGVTPNDLGDADSGPNQLQNYPVITAATPGGSTQVAGTLNSLANVTFTIDFYANLVADPSGYGEGQRWLGSTTVTTDGAGNASFGVSLAAATTPGEFISATATNADGSTSEFSFAALLAAPGSLSGVVYEDFNNDGQIDFGESGIAGVVVTLTGTDDLGQPVNLSQTTAIDGAYLFPNLRPGDYVIAEIQPSGYTQGINTLGTAGGTQALDQFFVSLAQGVDGLNYNFGERPPATGAIQRGQTATIGFWNNKNGQALINSLNGGPESQQLANWLAATLPNIFGANAGSNNLTGKNNAEVAALFQQDFLMMGVKLDAQVLATALSVYATNSTLDPTQAAAAYGFTVSATGLGTSTINVGSNGDAYGVANNTTMTILDLLLATNNQTVNGVLYNGNTAKRNQANSVYCAVNQGGDIE